MKVSCRELSPLKDKIKLKKHKNLFTGSFLKGSNKRQIETQGRFKTRRTQHIKSPRSKKSMVYETLKKRIINNSLKPGEPMNEAILAKELKISKTPIREAIQQLERDGFVENISGRGTFFSKISPP